MQHVRVLVTMLWFCRCNAPAVCVCASWNSTPKLLPRIVRKHYALTESFVRSVVKLKQIGTWKFSESERLVDSGNIYLRMVNVRFCE